MSGPNERSETISVEARFASGSFQLLHGALLAGLGIALLPEPTCAAALADGSLVRILPEWGGADGIVHLVFTSRRGMLPGVRAVIEFLAAALVVAG